MGGSEACLRANSVFGSAECWAGLSGHLVPKVAREKSFKGSLEGPKTKRTIWRMRGPPQGLGFLILRGTGSSVARRKALGSRAAPLPASARSPCLTAPGSLSLGLGFRVKV